MDKAKLEQLNKLVDESSHIVLLQPENPDVDSLGAARALQICLEQIGKQSTIVCLRDIKGANDELFGTHVKGEFPENYDLVILPDTPMESLIKTAYRQEKKKFKNKPFVLIDHHPETPDEFNFANLKIIDPNAPAAAEIVYEIAKQLSWPTNADFARAVLLAYMYDSRKLTTNKVHPGTMRNVADLLEQGADIAAINTEYDQAFALDPEAYKRKGRLIRQVRFYRNGTIATYSIGKRLRQWLKTRGSLSEYLKYELLVVKGVKISIGLTEVGNDAIIVTMRAHVPIARIVAEAFGGGGHDLAAGCKIQAASIAKAKKLLIPVVEKALDAYENSN